MSKLESEQRTNIKFMVKLAKSGKEIREMLVQVFKENQCHSPDGKLVGCGATHSPPISAKGKNEWNNTTSAP